MWSAESYETLVEDEDTRLVELQDGARDVTAKLEEFSRLLIVASAEVDPKAAGSSVLTASASGDAAQRAYRDFKLELSGDVPASGAAALRRQCEDHGQRLERLLGTLTFLRTTQRREALLGGGGDEDGGVRERTPAGVIALGLRVQTESQLALTRMTRMVESSKQVGTATLGTLHAHHARLDRVHATVDAQVYQFAQAERELSEYSSDALNDNLTLGLLLAVGVCLAGLLVYHLTVLDPASATNGAWSRGGQLSVDKGGWPTDVYASLDPRLTSW